MEDKPPKKEKQIYFKTIINLLKKCDDIELLDFIMQLLQKSNSIR